MAASRVQTVDGYNSGGYSSGQTFAFPGNTVAGNAITVILEHSYVGCPPSLTDTQSNTYTSKGTQPSPASGIYLWVFTAVAGSSAACTITVTFSCGVVRTFFAAEVSGLQADPYDVEATLGDTTSPYGTGGMTTTANGDYIMAMWNKSGSTLGASSVSSPLSFVTNGTGYATADGVQASAGSIDPEITGPTGTIYGFTAAFKATATTSSSANLVRMRRG